MICFKSQRGGKFPSGHTFIFIITYMFICYTLKLCDDEPKGVGGRLPLSLKLGGVIEVSTVSLVRN